MLRTTTLRAMMRTICVLSAFTLARSQIKTAFLALNVSSCVPTPGIGLPISLGDGLVYAGNGWCGVANIQFNNLHFTDIRASSSDGSCNVKNRPCQGFQEQYYTLDQCTEVINCEGTLGNWAIATWNTNFKTSFELFQDAMCSEPNGATTASLVVDGSTCNPVDMDATLGDWLIASFSSNDNISMTSYWSDPDYQCETEASYSATCSNSSCCEFIGTNKNSPTVYTYVTFQSTLYALSTTTFSDSACSIQTDSWSQPVVADNSCQVSASKQVTSYKANVTGNVMTFQQFKSGNDCNPGHGSLLWSSTCSMGACCKAQAPANTFVKQHWTLIL
eukprot:TRINITY_DN8953_c0_g1_i3.p1 TRINITY_DN8953_c0_g1~~TRINITY_DN8953_c0_g1_i3.p1  ORF type:complete len:332 (+),score=-47.46 TRINITY_DN8953_c0_g1_i3:71-1066(+)